MIGCFLTLARTARSCLTFSIGVCFLGWGWLAVVFDDVVDVAATVDEDGTFVGGGSVVGVPPTGAFVSRLAGRVTALSQEGIEGSVDDTGVVKGTVLECVDG